MTSTTALRFKITLLGIRPPVWRRIEIPDDATFWTLPCAIQDAMGWTDTHLHEFRRGRSRAGVGYPPGSESIGIPDPEWPEDRVRAGWRTSVSDCFAEPGDSMLYLYDFGDDCHHRVALEAKESHPAGISAPACLGGRRACPPEDIGGVSGYESLVAFLSGDLEESALVHDREAYEYFRDYDPARFDPRAVVFSDPAKRMRELWET